MAPIIAKDPVTFTCVLEARRETVDFFARLLHQRQRAIATGIGMRALGPFKRAVLALRWFLDNTRVRQLTADNAIATSTACDDGALIHTDPVAMRGPNAPRDAPYSSGWSSAIPAKIGVGRRAAGAQALRWMRLELVTEGGVGRCIRPLLDKYWS